LTDYDLRTTGRQVKTIRLRFGWLRASTGLKKAEQTAATHQVVEQAIFNGPGRSFGRRWFISYLRQQLGFKLTHLEDAVDFG